MERNTKNDSHNIQSRPFDSQISNNLLPSSHVQLLNNPDTTNVCHAPEKQNEAAPGVCSGLLDSASAPCSVNGVQITDVGLSVAGLSEGNLFLFDGGHKYVSKRMLDLQRSGTSYESCSPPANRSFRRRGASRKAAIPEIGNDSVVEALVAAGIVQHAEAEEDIEFRLVGLPNDYGRTVVESGVVHRQCGSSRVATGFSPTDARKHLNFTYVI